MRVALWDEYDVVPDVDPKPFKYRSRCPECWQSFGCAPGCPNEEFEQETTEADSHV